MGLQQISTHHAVVPRNKQNIDQTLSERMEILAPYLAAIAKAKESNQSDSSEHQLLDVLYRLVEMTELSNLKAAESETLAPYLAVIAKAKESNPSDSPEHQILAVLSRLVGMTELSKLKAAVMVADWYRTRRDVVLAEMEALP